MSKRFRGRAGGWQVTSGNPFHNPYSGKHRRAKRKLPMATYKILTLKRKAPSSLAVINRRTGGYVDLERKFADSELTVTSIGTSYTTLENATMGCLSATAIGDGPENRDGRVYHISSIQITGAITTPSLEASVLPASEAEVRLKLVWDKQTNAAQMTGANLMDEGGTTNVDSFPLLENSRRFTVLKSKHMVMKPHNVAQGAVNLFANPFTTRPFQIYHSFKKPLRVQCIGGQSTAVIASIADNSLHLVGICTNSLFDIRYQVRIRFQG